MARSSSTSRAAKLAQRSGRAKVRFQGGTLFPAIVAMVLVIGLATIVYARQSRPAADDSPPTVNDHWHASYGFYLCDPETGEMGWQELQGSKENFDDSGNFIGAQPKYEATGVHSHDDGVIHWHAFTSRATGSNATLGLFLDVYDVELSDGELKFPDDQLGGAEYDEDDTNCGDEDGEVRVQVWENFQDEGAGRTYTTDFDDIRFDRNSMVFSIGFAADDVTIPKPPEAARLLELGAVDQDTTELPADASTPPSGASTLPASGASTPASGAATPASGASTPASGASTPPSAANTPQSSATAPPTPTSSLSGSPVSAAPDTSAP